VVPVIIFFSKGAFAGAVMPMMPTASPFPQNVILRATLDHDAARREPDHPFDDARPAVRGVCGPLPSW
jgi:hypothetical protein